MPNLLQILFKPEWDQLPGSLAVWLGLTTVGAMFAFAGWRLGRQAQPSPQRRRAVPWNAPAVLVVWMISLFTVMLFAGFLLQIGFFHALYGPGFSYDRQGRSLAGTTKGLDSIRLGLWASAIAFPFQIAAILGFLRSFAGARLFQFGLTTARAGQNAYLGFLTWLVILPAAYFFHTLSASLYQHWMQTPPGQHALEQLVQAGPSRAEWGLIVVSAVILAPVLEELLFRGILQPWLTLRPLNGDMVLGASLALVLARIGWGAFLANNWADFAEQVQPVVFVLLMGIVYLVVRSRQRSPVPGAIFTSSLFFAAYHPTWPQPIPLFVLALALGYLAYRRQSLVGPMVLHALFNAFACGLLVLGLD